MQPRFNINRPPVTDEEIEKHKDFDSLVAQFKKQSLKKARGDESWWKSKKVQYSTVILGVTVICTITYQSIKNKDQPARAKHETTKTLNSGKTRQTAATPYVKPQIKKLDKKPTLYSVNNQKGAQVKHGSSTRITVPSNSFVDKSGHAIVGDITLEYREFDNLADIIGGGIPMAHDSAGKHYQLESAGMFEINASKDGDPVYLKPGSPIVVDLASGNDENRFHQYYLDTATRNWRFLGPDNLKISEKKHPQAAPPVQPLASVQLDVKSEMEKKRDSVKRYYAAALKNLPRPAEPIKPTKSNDKRPSFKLDGSFSEFPELSAFKNVLFEVGDENRNYSPAFHEVTWSNFRITEGPVKGKNYVLHLSRRNQKEQLIVYPVLSGADYERAATQYSDRLSLYHKMVGQRREREKQLLAEMEARQSALRREQQAEARVKAVEERIRIASNLPNTNKDRRQFSNLSTTAKARRVFEVTRFGIYNSDCPHLLAGARQIEATYASAAGNTRISPEAIYLVNHTIKSVSASGLNQPLAVLPGNEYSLCLIRDGMVFTCDRKAFKAVLNEGKSNFPVKEHPEATENIADLKTALEI